MYICGWCSVAKSYPTLCKPGLQHTRLPLLSLSPRVCSNSCPLNQWFHPTISSSYSLLLLPSVFPSIRAFSQPSWVGSLHGVAKVLEHFTKWKKGQSEKATYCMNPTIWEPGEVKLLEIINRWVIYKSCGRERWTGRARGILREWNYSVWSSNGGSVSLYICPNP